MPRQRPRISMDAYDMASPQIDGFEQPVAAPTSSRRGKRVESVPVAMVYPDRFQPRPQLPHKIAEEFYGQQIDCFEAMRRWMDGARHDQVMAARLERLQDLEQSVHDTGLIKPATGTWQRTEQGQDFFFLETGERRFWAVVLDAVEQGRRPEEVVLEAISTPEPSRRRQAEENEKSEKLTAVGRAREIAGLLLDFLGIQPNGAKFYGPYEYPRQVSEHRISEDMWDEVGKITGLGRSRMVQILQILKLDDDILDVADAYDIQSKHLYEIARMPYVQAKARLGELVKSVEMERGEERDLLTDEKEGEDREDTPAPISNRPAKYNTASPSLRAARRLKSTMVSLVEKVGRNAENPISTIATDLFEELEDPEQIAEVADRLESLAVQLRLRLNQES